MTIFISVAALLDQHAKESHVKDCICSQPAGFISIKKSRQEQYQEQDCGHPGKDESELHGSVKSEYEKLQDCQDIDHHTCVKQEVSRGFFAQ